MSWKKFRAFSAWREAGKVRIDVVDKRAVAFVPVYLTKVNAERMAIQRAFLGCIEELGVEVSTGATLRLPLDRLSASAKLDSILNV